MAECPDQDIGVSSSRLTSSLLINIEDLLQCQGVEKQRVEFKESWNTGPTKFQVIKTVSAFANDYYNDNGGYIVIGVAEDGSEDANGQIKLPPVGIKPSELDRTQKQIAGACSGCIKPPYTPILSPEMVQGRHVLVIWAQASDNRPHEARESEKGRYSYFIRKGVETKRATQEEIKELLANSTKVPFDDRMARHESGRQVTLGAVSRELVDKFLDDVRSNLDVTSNESTLEKLNLVIKHGDQRRKGRLCPLFAPKNVALLMFNKNPSIYFPGAMIEVSQYSRDREVLDERVIKGPLQEQIKQAIDFVLKTTNKETSIGSVTYPHRALREAVVNAVYHRGYEVEHNSPIKINIRPNCLEIYSYPGPDRSLKEEHFKPGNDVPQVPARNRRIGDFLKDLKLAEARGTGVFTIFKTMKKNTNDDPKFTFDSTYFKVILPAHPKFQASMLMKDVEELEAKGNTEEARELLVEAFDENPSIINDTLIQKLICLYDLRSDHPVVQKYAEHISALTHCRCSLLRDLKDWLAVNPRGYISRGVVLIRSLVKAKADAKDLADVTKFVEELTKEYLKDGKPNLSSNQSAHQLLEAYGHDILSRNSNIAWCFVCAKYNIYTLNRQKIRRGSSEKNASKSILSYLTDAKELLEHAIIISEQAEEKPSFVALQYRQLGYIHFHLFHEGKATASEYKECYRKARELEPRIRINSTMDS